MNKYKISDILCNIFYPLRKFIIFLILIAIPFLNNYLGLFRESIAYKYKKYFYLVGVIKMINWYWWIIFALIVYIVLKAIEETNRCEKTVKKIYEGKLFMQYKHKKDQPQYFIYKKEFYYVEGDASKFCAENGIFPQPLDSDECLILPKPNLIVDSLNKPRMEKVLRELRLIT